jgi:histidine triad (HIT) family protein
VMDSCFRRNDEQWTDFKRVGSILVKGDGVMKNSKDQDCVFCRILANPESVGIIYEDEQVVVFPVLEPVNPGHVVVVSRRHAPLITDLDEVTAAHAMKIACKMSEAIRNTNLKCEAINLYVADGEEAGQEVLHFHLHVYPRYKDDGFGFKYDPLKHFIKIDQREMDEIATEIKRHLA